MISRTDRHHDVLLAFDHVGHRSGGRSGRQIHFPDHTAGRFVVRAELRSPRPIGAGGSADGVAAFAEKQQCLGEERRGAVRIAERRQVEILQQRMKSWSVAVGPHPDVDAAIEIDRRDSTVGTFDDWQAVDADGVDRRRRRLGRRLIGRRGRHEVGVLHRRARIGLLPGDAVRRAQGLRDRIVIAGLRIERAGVPVGRSPGARLDERAFLAAIASAPTAAKRPGPSRIASQWSGRAPSAPACNRSDRHR